MAAPGERLADRYELIEQIGAGGMATVWRGRDTRLGRQVAVKLLRPELGQDEELVRRFESEARHAASVSHPNVATVFDTDVDGGQPFIVMELVDGPSLDEILVRQGPIEPRVAVDMAASAARALAAAHRRGLIHRDVKPANLLIGRDGRVRLADFGIARALTSSRVTAPGTILGSVPYLSPEQAEGSEATAAGDVFSLGVVLYEMLTGRLPWDAETPAALATVRLHVPAPPPSLIVKSLPDGLDAIVGRALARDPADRYPSARVFADALQAWNRRNRPSGSRRSIVSATTALVARAAPRPPEPSPRLATATAGVSGVAAPNPWARRRLDPGGTRRDMQEPSRPRRPEPTPPARPAQAAAAIRPAVVPRAANDSAAELADGRRTGLLLGLLALGLLVAVTGAMLLGGEGNATPTSGPLAAGAGANASATPAAPVAPAATAVIVTTPSPTPIPTAVPTPTVAPTPIPTPRPTPRPTVAPSVAPATRSAAASAVVSFYNAVEAHNWDVAIALWSPSMQRRYPPQEWLIDRFKRTTRIDITHLQTVSFNATTGRARVAVTIVEYRTVEPSPRTFVGAWDLVRIDGRWLLDDPDF